MTGKRWSSGNTRPGSRPGAQSPEPGKGRRAAPLRRHPQGVALGRKGRRGAQARRLGGRRPLRTPRARLCLRLSLPARGRGRRGQSGRSVLATALLRDSLGACGQCGAFTCLLPLCFFFFFLLLCFKFFYVLFFCVCGFFCPSWSQKETVAVSLQQKQRGGCFAGAAQGQPGRAAGWKGRGHQPCPLSPTPCPPPALPAPCPTASGSEEHAVAPASSCLCYGGAEGLLRGCLWAEQPLLPHGGRAL